MGTGGAQFLGFVLATLSIVGAMKTAAAMMIAIPVLVFGVPLFDAIQVVIRRRLSGVPITQADKRHIHHQLLARGLSQRQAVLGPLCGKLSSCVRCSSSPLRTMDKPLIALVVGTRPDAIKSAPVVLEFLRCPELCRVLLISTGQHREMLTQALGAFGITPDIDLGIMKHGQTLGEVTSGSMLGLEKAFALNKPDFVFAQGDTTTTFVASLAAFYARIPFGHVEAGLRTPFIDNPFPEEFNRRATGLIASQHYAPTDWAKANLLKEGKDPATVFVTGNTGIDAVKKMAEIATEEWFEDYQGRVCLLTTHRRENWGEPQKEIARATLRLAEAFPDTLWVVPMHRNPMVRETLTGILGNHDRIKLIEPPDYAPFVKLMKRLPLDPYRLWWSSRRGSGLWRTRFGPTRNDGAT